MTLSWPAGYRCRLKRPIYAGPPAKRLVPTNRPPRSMCWRQVTGTALASASVSMRRSRWTGPSAHTGQKRDLGRGGNGRRQAVRGIARTQATARGIPRQDRVNGRRQADLLTQGPEHRRGLHDPPCLAHSAVRRDRRTCGACAP